MVELTPALINKYYNQFITMINPRYISGVLDQEGNVMAIGIVVPSMGQAIKKSKGKLFPLGWARILRATRQKNTELDLLLVAVDPKYQGKGLNAVLMNQMVKSAIEDGMTYAETGPELETNEKVQAPMEIFLTRSSIAGGGAGSSGLTRKATAIILLTEAAPFCLGAAFYGEELL